MEAKDREVADQETIEEEEIDLAPVHEILDSFPSRNRRYLIPMLQKVQGVYRYLPDKAMQVLMQALEITRAEIFGVISFYPGLLTTEPGKYIIKLCYGTACFVKGANIIANRIHETYHIHPGDTDETKLFTLQTASCLGNCGAAPMAIVGEDTYGTIDPDKTLELLGAYKLDDEPEQQAEEITSE
ncbi:TPA: NAD(P)H-dependent oxidoreductase subunit E [Candidatus Poribacteria bacterium]|jgi:NADH:ubiquinone oxidoreductase subunit E|nr:NAD(P)H-dependent oxidoreductase subunit E [Candidatus Poribacteria bacterium]